MSLTEFLDELVFTPDRFQLEAMEAVQAGESVLVTAPTGAGKTLVAEAAVRLTLEGGKRAFYTTPLKALSNQKYGDFLAVYGSERTGLLTGDNSINGDAPVVVMTTEVLRNMIYAHSPALRDLGVVILDEVHYLQDPARGGVWEEIIIHLDRQVPLVCLSATVSNADQFADWVRERRGATRLVVETHRPVPLEDLYMIGDRRSEQRFHLMPTFATTDGRRLPNPKIPRLLHQSRGRRGRFTTPRRSEVIEALADEDLLPAIYFVFSRAGCESASARVASDVGGLTSVAERLAIAEFAEDRTSHLAPDDLQLLGYDSWLHRLERGVAAHHAGMVPAFKETVERLFAEGLVKVVFATETLALGINMPARSVVLENLSKFTGEHHELLQAGDYTQLTGRAGRRGIDSYGVAVVLYSPFVPFERVAAIAGAGSHPLRSSFRPGYNMAVNLVANYPKDRAEELLAASFAQFQRKSETEALTEAAARNEQALAGFEQSAACELGDIWQFLELVERGDERVPSAKEAMRDFARRSRPGDVLEVPERGGGDRFVLLARSWTAQPQMLLIDRDGRTRRSRPEHLPLGTSRIGRIRLPEPYRPREEWFREAVRTELAGLHPSDRPEVAGEILDSSHPVAGCPELRSHLRWARRARRTRRELERQRHRVAQAESALVSRFRSTLALLEAWGYSDGWRLTDRGERLRFVYNEMDLLVTEAVLSGLFDGLTPGECAALASAFVYEPRVHAEPGGWPTGLLRERGASLLAMHARLIDSERTRHLDETRAPDEGFAVTAHAWAEGASLDALFDEGETAVGDFVRNCRQILDLLRQLRDAFPNLSPAASAAIVAVDRGVVAAGGVG